MQLQLGISPSAQVSRRKVMAVFQVIDQAGVNRVHATRTDDADSAHKPHSHGQGVERFDDRARCENNAELFTCKMQVKS